jgi:hypothetical protein
MFYEFAKKITNLANFIRKRNSKKTRVQDTP